MRLRVLAEGSTGWQRFVRHWGLSVLIDEDMLFDTFGKRSYVLEQLKKIGAGAGKIRHIAISHDDWDHVEGLWKILELNRDVTVYVCPHFRDEIKSRIRWYGARLAEVKGITAIRDGIYLSGELTGRRGGCDIPEQYLAVKGPEGLTILTGCAHPGIVEIVEHAKAGFGREVCSLIGGFHLKDSAERDAEETVMKLRSLGVKRVMPMHCTGRMAQRLFRRYFKDDCIIPGEKQEVEI